MSKYIVTIIQATEAIKFEFPDVEGATGFIKKTHFELGDSAFEQVLIVKEDVR